MRTFQLRRLAGFLTLVLMAASMRLSAESVLEQYREHRVTTCIQMLEDEKSNSKAIVVALKVLSLYGDTQGVEKAKALLGHDDPARVVAATRYLAKLKVEGILDEVLALLDRESPLVQRAAIMALADLGDKKALQPLVEFAEKQKKYEFWADVAQAIAHLGDRRGANILYRMYSKAKEGIRKLRKKDRDETIPIKIAGWLGRLNAKKGFGLVKSDANQPGRPEFHLTHAGLTAVGRCDSKQAAKYLLDIVRKKRQEGLEAYREAAATALGELRNPNVISYVVKEGLGDRHEDTRTLVAYALGEMGCDQIVPYLVKLLRDKEECVRVAAIKALGQLGAVDQIKALLAMVKKGTYLTKVAVARALGVLADTEGVDTLLNLFLQDDSRIRYAAAFSLYNLRVKESVELFAKALDDTKDWLQLELLSYLRSMSGKDFGVESKPWVGWWEAVAGDFQILFEEDVFRKEETAVYYGIEITSKRVVFCLDISGSMEEKAFYTPDEEELTIETGKEADDGVPLDPPPDPKDSTRLKVAKWQFIRTLRQLPEDVHFTAIFYEEDLHYWEKTLEPATDENKKSCIEEVKKYTPGGGTNIYDTLKKCFNMAGDNVEHLTKPIEVDTVFLLSDGTPTAGAFEDPDIILEKIREMNPHGRIRIHTVGIGDHNADFMRRLALQNGGEYVRR